MKKFGRLSDINKSKRQLLEWEKSCSAFEEKKYLVGFRHLLEYIKIPSESNVEYQTHDSNITFVIFHNQLKIEGFFNEQELSISINLATLHQKPLPLLRKLLSLNYNFNYCCFVLRENQLLLKGYLTQIEYNPYTIYNLIQEMALKGDMATNGILYDKAKGDKLEGVEILKNFFTKNPQILETKWNLLKEWIAQTVSRSNELSSKAISDGASYLLLNLCYRIDYFLSPTGPLQIAIEQIHNDFFAENNLSTEEKNKKIIETLSFISSKLQNFPKHYLFTEAPYSFSFTLNFQLETILNQFNESLENYGWYQENNYPDVALECLEYGALYNTFSYQLPKVLEDLLELFLVVLNTSRIGPLNYPYELYCHQKPKFQIKSKFLGILGKETYSHFNIPQIQTILKSIYEEHHAYYPKFQFHVENLVFDNLLSFAISFTKELIQCDFNTYNSKL